MLGKIIDTFSSKHWDQYHYTLSTIKNSKNNKRVVPSLPASPLVFSFFTFCCTVVGGSVVGGRVVDGRLGARVATVVFGAGGGGGDVTWAADDELAVQSKYPYPNLLLNILPCCSLNPYWYLYCCRCNTSCWATDTECLRALRSRWALPGCEHMCRDTLWIPPCW